MEEKLQVGISRAKMENKKELDEEVAFLKRELSYAKYNARRGISSQASVSTAVEDETAQVPG